MTDNLTTDPIELLAAFQPTDETLDRAWPVDDRAAMQASIAAATPDASVRQRISRPGLRLPRLRWPVAAVAVGVAAAALVLVQVVLPSDTPGSSTAAGAATLEHLATRTQSSRADSLQPGQYRYFVATQPTGDTTEIWTSSTGDSWRHLDQAGTQLYYHFPAGDYLNNPSPGLLASLPTNPDALQMYLRTNVSGSSSTDKAVFVAVGDMLRGGFAPPDLRAAAIRVLEQTSHIAAKLSRDALGRAAVEVTFTDRTQSPGETTALLLDPTTSALLEEKGSNAASGIDGTVTYSDPSVVSAVPATVVQNATRPQPQQHLPGLVPAPPSQANEPSPSK